MFSVQLEDTEHLQLLCSVRRTGSHMIEWWIMMLQLGQSQQTSPFCSLFSCSHLRWGNFLCNFPLLWPKRKIQWPAKGPNKTTGNKILGEMAIILCVWKDSGGRKQVYICVFTGGALHAGVKKKTNKQTNKQKSVKEKTMGEANLDMWSKCLCHERDWVVVLSELCPYN